MAGAADNEGAAPADAGTDNPGVVARPPLLYLSTLLAGLAADYVLPIGLVAEALGPGWRFGGSAALILFGVAGISWAFGHFARAGTNVPTNLPAETVVTGGPYRFSRNPIYLALSAFFVGLAVLFASDWALALFPVLLAVMRYGVIAREERYLERKFGATYLAYKARVRRWL